MTTKRAYYVFSWVAFILFSSTALAGRTADRAFEWFEPFLLSTLSPIAPSRSTLHRLAEKGLHLILYSVFALLLWHALPRSRKRMWIVLGAGAVLGATSEILQAFSPARDPLVRDVLLNVLGTAVGVALASLANPAQKAINRNPL